MMVVMVMGGDCDDGDDGTDIVCLQYIQNHIQPEVASSPPPPPAISLLGHSMVRFSISAILITRSLTTTSTC